MSSHMAAQLESGTLVSDRAGTYGPASLDQLQAAHDHVARLASLARALIEGPTRPQGDLASRCACGRRPCVLDGAPGGARACLLAGDLARLPAGTAVAVAETDLVSAYLAALRDGAPAVFTCRRLLHASETCAFRAAGVPRDVCARVLALSHLIDRAAALR